MTKRMIIMLIFVTILFGGIFGYKAFIGAMMKKNMASRGAQPQTVSTTTASSSSWQNRLEAVGTLQAVRGADLAPEVSGLVTKINFSSGQNVEAGTLLLELDDSSELARLRSLEATAELARKSYRRDQEQFQVHTVSQATLDADIANLKSAEAQVAEQQALADKKDIRAPFAGRLGIRLVDIGQYLNAGTRIVTLQALDPIYVDFYLPQRSLSQIGTGMEVRVESDAYPEKTFAGAISAISPKIDADTRNIKVRARIQNPDHLLLPGMFVTAIIDIGTPKKEITLPQTAISFNPYGDIVFLVKEKGQDKDGKPRLVAEQKFVTTGHTRGDQIAILEGLKTGDTVVTSGQLKLRNHSPVVINNKIQPADNPSPTPVDQ
jgi:membrane fusion protein, multidrug efflux system